MIGRPTLDRTHLRVLDTILIVDLIAAGDAAYVAVVVGAFAWPRLATKPRAVEAVMRGRVELRVLVHECGEYVLIRAARVLPALVEVASHVLVGQHLEQVLG